MKEKVHSDEYIHAKSRDDWWNPDFFELLIKRFGLAGIESVADIGCGSGYLGMKLAGFIPSITKLFGLDFETTLVVEATHNFAQGQFHGIASQFVQGDAINIPLADNSVDLAICQTLLLHVKDPQRIIAEMRRITKPGGVVLALEPNNIVQTLISDRHLGTTEPTIEERLQKVEFMLRIEKGKTALGEGNNSIGDLASLYFQQTGIRNIQVFLNDKVVPLIPPYDAQAKRLINDEIAWIQNGQAFNDQPEMKRYYLAGGGNPAKFETQWSQYQKDSLDYVNACMKGGYYSPGATVFYVIGGNK